MLSMQQFTQTTEKLTGVKQLVVVSHEGNVAYRGNNQNIRLGDYIAYIVITAEQLKPHLGFTGPYHLIMEQSDGERILTILGDQIIVGICLDAHVAPTTIIDELAPLIDQVII